MIEILVCMKWVPIRPEIDLLSGEVSTDDRFSGAGPADLSALEWSLRLAEPFGGSVTVATIGPINAEPMLRDALAAGASRAVRVDSTTDRPSRWIAAELATLHGRADVTCCGDHSLDRGTGSVPAFLAHELGWVQALGLVSATPLGRGERQELMVERRLDLGRRERLRIADRAVLSFEASLRLRRASLAATLAATTASIEIRSPSSAVDAGREPVAIATGPFRPRPRVKAAPTGPTRDRLLELVGADDSPATATVHEVTPAEGAELVVEHLESWGYLGDDDVIVNGD